jgi:beta-lactamase regulating signal transducer with metallopeptidase domain
MSRWLLWGWVFGTMLVIARVALGRWLFSFCVRRQPVSDPALQAEAAAVAASLGLRRPVRLTETAGLAGPIAFGIWRPGISLPPGFASRFNAGQRRAMLAHELAHLQARDPLWQLCVDLIAAWLWWHPFAWVARSCLRAATETAADEASLVIENGPDALAESLVALGSTVAGLRPGAWLGVAAGHYQSGLGRRVARLMSLRGRRWRPVGRGRARAVRLLGALAAAVSVLVLAVVMQPEPPGGRARGAFRESLLGAALIALPHAKPASANPEGAPAPVASPVALPEQEAVEPGGILWQPWSRAAVAEARAAHRPVLVFFSADWAVTAGMNERTSLDVPAVRQKLLDLGVAVLRADYTRGEEEVAAELRTFGRSGVPLTLVYAEDGKSEPEVLPDVLTPQLVLDALERARSVKAPSNSPNRAGLATGGEADGANQVSAILLAGKRALDAGQLEEATAFFRKALLLDPANPLATRYLAQAQAPLPHATGSETAKPIPPYPSLATRLTNTVAVPSAQASIGRLFPEDEAVAEAGSAPDLRTRWFRVDPETLLAALGGRAEPPRVGAWGKGQSIDSALDSLRSLLRAAGVDLAATGRQFFYVRRTGMLMVRATLVELDLVEGTLQALATTPLQVMVEVKLCELPDEALSALTSKLPARNPLVRAEGEAPDPHQGFATSILSAQESRQLIQTLERQRGANLLSAPRVTTLSGRQAQIKTVQIRYIVTDLSFETNGPAEAGGNSGAARTATTGRGQEASVIIQPIAQPFELGPIVDVLPSVLADGVTISMQVTTTIRAFQGYDHEPALKAAVRRGGTTVSEQLTPLPRFQVRSVSASAVVRDGQTLVLTGGRVPGEPAASPPKATRATSPKAGPPPRATARAPETLALLILITPRLIDPAGNAVHSEAASAR